MYMITTSSYKSAQFKWWKVVYLQWVGKVTTSRGLLSEGDDKHMVSVISLHEKIT